jgi:hypothetical protein
MRNQRTPLLACVQLLLTIGAMFVVILIPVVMYQEHSKPNLLRPPLALYGRVLSIVLLAMLAVGAVVDARDPRGGIGSVLYAWKTRHEREGPPKRSAGLVGDVVAAIIIWVLKSAVLPLFIVALPLARLRRRLAGSERRRTATRIQYEVDRQRRDLPPSAVKTKLKKALRKRPVEQPDRSWLVYELDDAGQVFYWPGEQSYTLLEPNGRLHSFLNVQRLAEHLR